MKTLHKSIAAVALTAALSSTLWSTPAHAATSGTVTWGDWQFNYQLADDAGVVLTAVTYKGTLYINKASMPVVRVQYDYTCGPYMDRFKPGYIKPSGNPTVHIDDMGGGTLRVWIEAQISSYLLIQDWFFTANGVLQPRLESRGMQCQVTHRHHPYWRFDFDLAGWSNDSIFAQTHTTFDARPTEFWEPKGNVWWWNVHDSAANKGVWIDPDWSDNGADDPATNNFATWDALGIRYNSPHYSPWVALSNGSLADVGDLVKTKVNGENISNQDVVFWAASHLYHVGTDNGQTYYFVGPDITFY